MELVNVVPETPVHTATRFRPAGMFALVLAIAAASITYRLAGVNWFGSPLSLKSHLGFSVMLAFVVVGVYQFYFWIQQNDHFARRRSLRIALDDSIPFVPHWVWVYGILYYVMIGFVIVTIGGETPADADVSVSGDPREILPILLDSVTPAA